jgi:histidine triad (HIT) family protein
MADESCLFCRIVSGELPAVIVFEDENTLAFLDHRPLFPGHTLLIPREHFETLGDLPATQVGPLFKNAQLLSRVVETAMDAEGTFVAMNNRVSQSVPHLHVHIVPRRRKDGLKGFFWPRTKYKTPEEMEIVKQKIAAELEKTNLEK